MARRPDGSAGPAARIDALGDSALIVVPSGLQTAHALAAWIRALRLPGCVEVVPGAVSVLVVFRDATTTGRATGLLATELADAAPPAAVGSFRLVEIPVLYDGPDLWDVSEVLGVTPEELIRRHTGSDWTATFSGFAPGFAYLTGGGASLRVPRRSTPRISVPAGAVALAGGMSAVYPQSTPGGWQVIGRTDAVMFAPDRPEPALVRPGDSVRFRAVDSCRRHSGAPQVAPTATHGPGLTVLRAGPQMTIQDRGREGLAHLGVTTAGAMDRGAADRANELVGNPADAAVLECLLAGPRLRPSVPVVVAVTGAVADLTVDGWPARPARPLPLPAGADIDIGPARQGCRIYIAVAGGVRTPTVLGSRSTDTMSGLGPRACRDGDRIPIGPRGAPTGRKEQPLATGRAVSAPAATATIAVQARPGPGLSWLMPAAFGHLAGQTWTVSPESDRRGIRLSGTPLTRVRSDEFPVAGTVAGAVQVPPDGQPIVLMRDRPTTGGYPLVAVVDGPGVDRLAQARPGDRVTFDLIR